MGMIRWHATPELKQGCTSRGCAEPAAYMPGYLIQCEDAHTIYVEQCCLLPFLCARHAAEDQAGPLRAFGNTWRVECRHCGAYHRALDRCHVPIDAARKALLESNSVIGTCAHCRSAGVPVQLHHFAPRARFWDADSWPTAFLCVPCHRLWHGVMGWRPGQKPLVEDMP